MCKLFAIINCDALFTKKKNRKKSNLNRALKLIHVYAQLGIGNLGDSCLSVCSNMIDVWILLVEIENIN